MVEVFLRDAPPRIANLGRAISDGSAQDVTSAAHALKGAAANVGALALSRACADLERTSGQDQWPQDAANQVALITDICAKSLVALRGWRPDATRQGT